jgi:hypothetical protein
MPGELWTSSHIARRFARSYAFIASYFGRRMALFLGLRVPTCCPTWQRRPTRHGANPNSQKRSPTACPDIGGTSDGTSSTSGCEQRVGRGLR